jgi:hypothetical protein
MGGVMILRLLWRRRALLACAAVLATLAGGATIYRAGWPPESRQYRVGIAEASVLVDTPRSQVVEITPKGSDTLGVRASLLANLMLEGELKDSIAQRAGLRPDQLDARREGSVEPAPPPAVEGRRAHVLSARVLINTEGERLPIIEIEAQAPDPRQAAAVANAAVGGLRVYLDFKALVDRVRDDRRLRVSLLGPPQARAVARGPRRILGVAVALLVFGAGCAAIVGCAGLARAWRAAAEEEAGAEAAVPSA